MYRFISSSSSIFTSSFSIFKSDAFLWLDIEFIFLLFQCFKSRPRNSLSTSINIAGRKIVLNQSWNVVSHVVHKWNVGQVRFIVFGNVRWFVSNLKNSFTFFYRNWSFIFLWISKSNIKLCGSCVSSEVSVPTSLKWGMLFVWRLFVYLFRSRIFWIFLSCLPDLLKRKSKCCPFITYLSILKNKQW